MNDEIAALESRIAELRDELSKARRRAPGMPVRDYTFRTTAGEVRLSDLFGDRQDLIVVHNMGRSCPYCTLWADGLSGLREHIEDRAAFVVASPDDPATQADFARSRGWTFRMVSGRDNGFARDMGFEPEPGKYMPGVSAFARQADGTIVRSGSAPFGPGDDFCAVWHLFDLLADGAGGWSPKYAYDPAAAGATR